MTWETPKTWALNDRLTADVLNNWVRDQQIALDERITAIEARLPSPSDFVTAKQAREDLIRTRMDVWTNALTLNFTSPAAGRWLFIGQLVLRSDRSQSVRRHLVRLAVDGVSMGTKDIGSTLGDNFYQTSFVLVSMNNNISAGRHKLDMELQSIQNTEAGVRLAGNQDDSTSLIAVRLP